MAEIIATLTAEIEARLDPFAGKAELLITIPGVAQRTSQVIIAELGPDMTRFSSDRHAASWAAICTFFTCAALTNSSVKSSSSAKYTGFQYTPVASIATSLTPSSAS